MKYTTKPANILPKAANLPDYKLDEKKEEPRIPHTEPEVNIWQKILKETSDKASLESSSKKSLMEMLSDEPLNEDKPSTDQMAVEKVDTTVKENFYISRGMAMRGKNRGGNADFYPRVKFAPRFEICRLNG